MQYLNKSPLLLFASAALAWAVPSEINYQGRLTDANGDPVTGEVSMSLKMFDAATAGNELYSEDLGTVTLDDNGVYSFQFGASGQSVVDREETIAITDGSSTTFSNTLGSVPLDETLVVADGTYSWNVVDGNPGEQATATAVLANGFVIGVTVTNGGEGYVEPPVVTIEGLGTGATATAVVEDGVITAINVDATGSGYTSATVTIAEPPAPYVVDYDAGAVSVTYETAPSAGTEILATYEANDSSIVGALSAADAHWLELSADGTAQTPRERVLSVPFAQVAGVSASATRADTKIEQLEQYIALNAIDINTADRKVGDGLYIFFPNLSAIRKRLEGGYTWDLSEKIRYVVVESGYPIRFQYLGRPEASGTMRQSLGLGIYKFANPYPASEVTRLTIDGGVSKTPYIFLTNQNIWESQLASIPKNASEVFVTVIASDFLPYDSFSVEILSDNKSQLLATNRSNKLEITPSEIRALKLTLTLDENIVSKAYPVVNALALRFY